MSVLARKTRALSASTALWSLVCAVALLFAYLWRGYLGSIDQFDTGGVLQSVRASVLQPSLFWWQLGRYFLALLACHFLLFYLLAEVARIRHAGWARRWRTVALWVVGLLFLHALNSGYFPHSALAFDMAYPLPVAVLAATFLLVLLLLGACHLWWRALQRWGKTVLVPSVLLAGLWAGHFGLRWAMVGPQQALPADKPNIILIGVDCLRPDVLAYMHAWETDYDSPMPFLDKQLRHSVVFSRAYTPIARTYPAWMAVLTGQDPLYSGVRVNLQDDYGWWRGEGVTLPQYLGKHGYQTAWGIDGPAFANIGYRQGFDTVLSPQPGAAGTLVSMVFSDIPVVNAFSNLPWGRWLFPLNYSNRARGYAYYPSTFSGWLADYVHHRDANKPLFLAVHFELAHYPGIWANDGMPWEDIYERGLGHLYYRYALKRIDVQIRHLMHALRANGRLQNAIVVFLSDHGNGMFTGEMGRNQFGDKVFVGDTSSGHGVNIANLAETHALLAVRGYGHSALEPGYRDGVVSLMDVTPTVLSALGIRASQPMQGVPLPLWGQASRRHRTVYLETGLYLPGLGTGKMDFASDVARVADLYRVRRNGRLVIRKKTLPGLYRTKDRAAYDGHFLVATRVNYNEGKLSWFVINTTTGDVVPINDKSLQRPELAGVVGDFCRHYTRRDPYFVSPPFCDAVRATNGRSDP